MYYTFGVWFEKWRKKGKEEGKEQKWKWKASTSSNAIPNLGGSFLKPTATNNHTPPNNLVGFLLLPFLIIHPFIDPPPLSFLPYYPSRGHLY